MIDGYHKWLGIPKDQRPPTYYQLLGIAPREQDSEVIEAAAVRQVAFVRNFQSGPHAEQCSRILTELAEARITLLNPAKRGQYDAALAARRTASLPPPQSAPNHSINELAELSSLLTEVRIEPVDRGPGSKGRARGGQRKGWSSLAIALQCGITGFTLVAAYYLLAKWPRAASPTTSAPARLTRPAEIAKPDPGPNSALWEVVFEPADAACVVTGADVHVTGSAPGRCLIAVNDLDLKQPRSLKISLEKYKPLTLELVTQSGGRTRTHIELEGLESNQNSTYVGIDAHNLFPFPARPLTLDPRLSSSGGEQVTPSPSELDLRSHPPQVKFEIEGLDTESEDAPEGGRRYRIPGADGLRTGRARATLDGYKTVEKTLTPLPGERRTLTVRLEPVGSTGESAARLGSVTALPPIPSPSWAVLRVQLDPVPRSFSAVATGLKVRSYRIERGIHLYQIAAPDGTSPIRFHYSAQGFKPLETALTPRPGERQDLTFHFASNGSSDESRIILNRDAKPRALEASPGLRPEVRIIDQELRRFEGSLTRIDAVAMTPDGKRALSAGADGRIRIYDPGTGRLLRQFHAHKEAVLALAVSSTGHQLLTSGVDPVVRLWDIATGHSTGIVFSGCTAPVVCVAFTSKGDNVCAGDARGFRLWNVVGVRAERRFPLVAETPIVALAVTPHNDGVYLARTDRIVACDITGMTEGRQVGPILEDTRLTALDVAPGGGLLIVGCNDGTLRLWDARSGVEIRRFEKHEGRVNSVQFSSNGKSVVSGAANDDPTIRLWDVNTGLELARFKGHSQAVTRVIFTPGDRQLLSGSQDRTVRLWDVPN